MISKDYVTGAISCYRVKNAILWVAALGMIKDDELKLKTAIMRKKSIIN